MDMFLLQFIRMLAVLCTVVVEADSVQNVRLVFPPVVRVGDSATLLCLYDLEGSPLYSVKWYRGIHEFYRFTPKESPPGRVFPFEGIIVDPTASNAHQVSLKNIPLHLSGNLSCEVSADAPSFSTQCAEKQLTVLEIPDSRPVMTVMNTNYREGKVLTVNCTTHVTKPSPTLTFYINNRAVPQHLVKVQEGGAVAVLQTLLPRSEFSPRGELRLKCVASTMGLYNISSGSVAIWLENGKPSAFETEAASDPKNSADNKQLFVGMVLWLYSVHAI